MLQISNVPKGGINPSSNFTNLETQTNTSYVLKSNGGYYKPVCYDNVKLFEKGKDQSHICKIKSDRNTGEVLPKTQRKSTAELKICEIFYNFRYSMKQLKFLTFTAPNGTKDEFFASGINKLFRYLRDNKLLHEYTLAYEHQTNKTAHSHILCRLATKKVFGNFIKNNRELKNKTVKSTKYYLGNTEIEVILKFDKNYKYGKYFVKNSKIEIDPKVTHIEKRSVNRSINCSYDLIRFLFQKYMKSDENLILDFRTVNDYGNVVSDSTKQVLGTLEQYITKYMLKSSFNSSAIKYSFRYSKKKKGAPTVPKVKATAKEIESLIVKYHYKDSVGVEFGKVQISKMLFDMIYKKSTKHKPSIQTPPPAQTPSNQTPSGHPAQTQRTPSANPADTNQAKQTNLFDAPT